MFSLGAYVVGLKLTFGDFEQKDMIVEVFNLFDTDGQQQLDEDELASAIFALGFSQNDHVQVTAWSDISTYWSDLNLGTDQSDTDLAFACCLV